MCDYVRIHLERKDYPDVQGLNRNNLELLQGSSNSIVAPLFYVFGHSHIGYGGLRSVSRQVSSSAAAALRSLNALSVRQAVHLCFRANPVTVLADNQQ